MSSIEASVMVSIHDFDDETVLRAARGVLELRAADGELSPQAEREIERIAMLLGLIPGSLPPASSAAMSYGATA